MNRHLLNKPTLQTYSSIIVPLAERRKEGQEEREGKIQRPITEDEKDGKVGRV